VDGAVVQELGYSAALEGRMGVVQVQLPDDLKQVIDRQIAEGRALNEADFLVEAARLYAAHLDIQEEIAEMVERTDGPAVNAANKHVVKQLSLRTLRLISLCDKICQARGAQASRVWSSSPASIRIFRAGLFPRQM
jgi:hypothetical protein